MGDIHARNAERHLQRALERAETPTPDPALATRNLQQLAAILPSTRPDVTNDVEASKKHARALARELKLSKSVAHDLVLAAELHEVGKATIDRDALYAPGELDVETKAAVEEHATKGAELVASIDRPGVAAALAMQIERHDGTGPSGVHGEDLPVLARALSVISAYVAMTSRRPFRDALDREHALEVLRTEAGGQFDGDIVEAFIRAIPRKKFAVAAASASASIARPIRGIQLAYRRHGRVSTAVVSSFTAAAVLIGASTLAPGGIGQAFERMSWPTQARQGSAVAQDSAIALAADGSSGFSNAGPASDAPVTGTLVGVVETIAFDLTGSTSTGSTSTGSTSTEATTIEGGYEGTTTGSDEDGQEPASGDGATTGTGGGSDAPEDSGETEESPGGHENKSNKDKDKEPGTKDKEATPEEPEPSVSPTPEETDDYETSSSADAPGQIKKGGPSSEGPTETTPGEASPSDSSEDGETDGGKDKDPGRHDSDTFKAYQSEEQDDETEGAETSDPETDDLDTEEGTTDEPVESETEVEEAPVPTASRDTTPVWGSLH